MSSTNHLIANNARLTKFSTIIHNLSPSIRQCVINQIADTMSLNSKSFSVDRRELWNILSGRSSSSPITFTDDWWNKIFTYSEDVLFQELIKQWLDAYNHS
jgi:hypothetical protein